MNGKLQQLQEGGGFAHPEDGFGVAMGGTDETPAVRHAPAGRGLRRESAARRQQRRRFEREVTAIAGPAAPSPGMGIPADSPALACPQVEQQGHRTAGHLAVEARAWASSKHNRRRGRPRKNAEQHPFGLAAESSLIRRSARSLAVGFGQRPGERPLAGSHSMISHS